MDQPYEQLLQASLDELERAQRELAEAQQSISEISTTCTSPDRSVSVTVDGHGDVRAVGFPTTEYSLMSGAELGRLIVATIRTAREEMADRVRDIMGPLLEREGLLGGVDGTPVPDMLSSLRDMLGSHDGSSRNGLRQ